MQSHFVYKLLSKLEMCARSSSARRSAKKKILFLERNYVSSSQSIYIIFTVCIMSVQNKKMNEELCVYRV